MNLFGELVSFLFGLKGFIKFLEGLRGLGGRCWLLPMFDSFWMAISKDFCNYSLGLVINFGLELFILLAH